MDANLAWAGGLFEGEGCISKANKHSVRLDVGIHQRDLDVLRRFKRILGTGKIYGPYKNKMVFWIAFGREVSTAVLLDLWPFLGRRRKKKVLEFLPRFRYYGKWFKHRKVGGRLR